MCKKRYLYLFVILSFLDFKKLSTSDFKKYKTYIGQKNNNNKRIIEELMYKISNGIYEEFKIKNGKSYFVKISKISGEKNKILWESDIPYLNARQEGLCISLDINYYVENLYNFFRNDKEKEINIIFYKDIPEGFLTDIFFSELVINEIKIEENKKLYTEYKFKQKIDLEKEKKDLEENIYFLNFCRKKVFSSISKELIPKNQINFIKNIDKNLKNKNNFEKFLDRSVLVAFDKRGHNILGQIYYYDKKDVNNYIYITDLTLNNFFNFRLGIGIHLLNATKSFFPRDEIRLFSIDSSIKFYEKNGFKFNDDNEKNKLFYKPEIELKSLSNYENYEFFDLKI